MMTLKGIIVQSLLIYCKFFLRLIISIFVSSFLPVHASEIIEEKESDDFLLKSQYLDILEYPNGQYSKDLI